MADQIAVSLTSVIRGMDQDVKQPHVHQFSAGITREIMWNMAVEARYVGSRGRDIWRGVDLNQLDAIGALGGAFAADFQRARQNGFLALAAGGGFVPDFNPNIPGEPGAHGAADLSASSTSRPSGRPSSRTSWRASPTSTCRPAAVTTTAARAAFLANPGIYASEYMDNTSFQDYDALQLELRRQFRHGIFGQINYTFSETRSDSIGDGSQNRIEPFLDNAGRDWTPDTRSTTTRMSSTPTRSSSCPSAQGKRWLNGGGFTDALFGGWQLATIVKWQSGAPLSISSARGTFNRTGRSGRQTAVTSLTTEQIKALFGVRIRSRRRHLLHRSVGDRIRRTALAAPDSLRARASTDRRSSTRPLAKLAASR